MAKWYVSEVWNFFDVDCADKSLANYNISDCLGNTRKIRRGTCGGSISLFN